MDAEHLIVGAGCAGLSLAVRLAAQPVHERGRVVVIEPRTALGGDRTWCTWRGRPHPFEAAITHRWSKWRVVGARGAVVHTLPNRPYEQVDSVAFAAVALTRLEQGEGVEVRLGTTVRELHDEGASVRVDTDAGTLRARLVWDGRGGAPAIDRGEDDVCWLQHFVGWVVRTERPIFDPSTVTLMDFEVSQERGPHFVYVLPYAEDLALVEDTYFSEHALSEDEYASTLRAWLDRRGAGRFEVLRRERGAIPMDTAPVRRRASPRIVPIGLRAGAAKPSTGYAFAFIQRHSDALAIVAGDGARPPPQLPVRSPVATFFDRVFLSFLRRRPHAAPELFGALFARTPPASLVRFLLEEGGVRDHLAVMNGVPRLALALEAVRARRIWMRPG